MLQIECECLPLNDKCFTVRVVIPTTFCCLGLGFLQSFLFTSLSQSVFCFRTFQAVVFGKCTQICSCGFWILLVSAVALSSVKLWVYAGRRNILQYHVFSFNGQVLMLLKIGWIIPSNCMSLLSKLEFTSVFLTF